MIRELWQWLFGVLFRSQPENPPSQPEEKSIPAKIGEGVLSPPPREDVGVEIRTAIREKQAVSSADGITEDGISTPFLEPAASPPREHPMWEIRSCKPREFDKVGRLFIQAGDLVIKVDGLPFYLISARDVGKLLTGEAVAVLGEGDHSQMGTAKPSASGRAVNFRIGECLYTVPFRNVVAVVEGRARKAAVFMGNGGR